MGRVISALCFLLVAAFAPGAFALERTTPAAVAEDGFVCQSSSVIGPWSMTVTDSTGTRGPFTVVFHENGTWSFGGTVQGPWEMRGSNVWWTHYDPPYTTFESPIRNDTMGGTSSSQNGPAQFSLWRGAGRASLSPNQVLGRWQMRVTDSTGTRGPFQIEFLSNGTWTFAGTVQGPWEIRGNNLWWTHYDPPYTTFESPISGGNSMGGTSSSDNGPATFEVWR